MQQFLPVLYAMLHKFFLPGLESEVDLCEYTCIKKVLHFLPGKENRQEMLLTKEEPVLPAVPVASLSEEKNGRE
jgi:hypothetical protein